MKLVTNNFRLHSANEFKDSVALPNTSLYYTFIGRSYPYANDNAVPDMYDNSDDLLYSAYDDMLYGKRIAANDVCLMIRRVTWQSGTVYDRYDNEATDLFDTDFYVINSVNAVFKCLNNNGGAPSTVEPTVESVDDNLYMTADGYQWKYMFTADTPTVTKFATADFFPVVANSSVSSNAVSGSIEVIDIVSAGPLKYTATVTGTIDLGSVGGNSQIIQLDSAASTTANAYSSSALYLVGGVGAGQQRKIVQYDGSLKRVLIETAFDVAPVAGSTTYSIIPNISIGGSGTGAAARAVINATSKSIDKVLVTEVGSGYNYAEAVVEGYSTVVANTSNTPVLRVIKPPAGGHGKNQAAELGARWVGVSTTFDAAGSGGAVVDENDFRVAGILKDPMYSNVVITVSSSSEFALDTGVTQANTNASGEVVSVNTGNNTITLTDVVGLFDTTNPIVGTPSTANSVPTTVIGQGTYFDQTLRIVATNKTNANGYFAEDETVTQPGREGINGANGVFYSSNNVGDSNTALIRLTHTRGVFNSSDVTTEWSLQSPTTGAQANIQSQFAPDIIYGSGEIVYIENMSPITKNALQTETFKFIFEF